MFIERATLYKHFARYGAKAWTTESNDPTGRTLGSFRNQHEN
jgi:hypothetical protein